MAHVWRWVVLSGVFISFFIADGWSYSYGIFFPELVEYFHADRGPMAYVPTLLFGLPMLISPFICSVLTFVGCRPLAIFAGIATFLALIFASFSNSIVTLCVTIGLLSSIGLASGYISSYVAVTYWFSETSRGFATGVAMAGSGVGAIVFPHILEFLNEHYYWRGTFRITAAICLNITLAGMLYRPFPKEAIQITSSYNELERNELTKKSTKQKFINASKDIFMGVLPENNILKNKVFLLYLFSNFILYLCISVPYLYIYDFAIQLNIDFQLSSWLLSAIALSRTIGQIAVGLFADKVRVSPNIIFGCCTILLGLATLILPFFDGFAGLCICCIVFGFGVSVTYVLPIMCMGEIITFKKAVTGFGLLQFVQGIGTIIGSPVGGWLYDIQNSYSFSFHLSGALMVFAGLIVSLLPYLISISMKGSTKNGIEDNIPKSLDSNIPFTAVNS